MKKVHILYQNTDGDKKKFMIQRRGCFDFVLKKNYQIINESVIRNFTQYEKVMSNIIKDAMENKLDIVLVFKAENLGRDKMEVFAAIDWFSNKNIEVWSVMEGVQKIDAETKKKIELIYSLECD